MGVAVLIMRRAMYNKISASTCQQPSQKENALMPYPHHPADEVAARGEAIYEHYVLPPGANRAKTDSVGSFKNARNSRLAYDI